MENFIKNSKYIVQFEIEYNFGNCKIVHLHRYAPTKEKAKCKAISTIDRWQNIKTAKILNVFEEHEFEQYAKKYPEMINAPTFFKN